MVSVVELSVFCSLAVVSDGEDAMCVSSQGYLSFFRCICGLFVGLIGSESPMK